MRILLYLSAVVGIINHFILETFWFSVKKLRSCWYLKTNYCLHWRKCLRNQHCSEIKWRNYSETFIFVSKQINTLKLSDYFIASFLHSLLPHTGTFCAGVAQPQIFTGLSALWPCSTIASHNSAFKQLLLRHLDTWNAAVLTDLANLVWSLTLPLFL